MRILIIGSLSGALGTAARMAVGRGARPFEAGRREQRPGRPRAAGRGGRKQQSKELSSTKLLARRGFHPHYEGAGPAFPGGRKGDECEDRSSR